MVGTISEQNETGEPATQLFQLITVDGDKLSYESYTATGELYDAFDLIKRDKGATLFIERKNEAIPERRYDNTMPYHDRCLWISEIKSLQSTKGLQLVRPSL